MGEIRIDSPYITQADIEACRLDLAVQADQAVPELNIICEAEVTEIDILFIGYLVMFKLAKPRTRIFIHLMNNHARSRLSETVKHYMVYAYLTAGLPVFSIKLGNEAEESVSRNTRGEFFPLSWYYFSRTFMPPVCITPGSELYGLFFTPSLGNIAPYLEETLLPPGVAYQSSNSELIAAIKRNLVEQVRTEDPKSGLHILIVTAFYQVLDRMRVTNMYCDNTFRNKGEKRKDVMAGNLAYEEAYRYFESVRGLLDEIRNAPAILQYVYAILLSSELLPGSLQADTAKQFRYALFNLWGFSKDLVKGLRELAKNILEHSLPPMGLITCRLYDDESYKTLAGTDEGKSSFIKRYDSESGQGAWIEINVCDMGGKGVIESLKDNTALLAESLTTSDPSYALVSDDLQRLNTGKVIFQHILNPSADVILNQQCKRSIAHFGLLTLTSLIKNNEGLLLAGTWKTGGEERQRDFVVLPGTERQKDYRGIPFGTCYQIVLPVNSSKQYQSFHAHPVSNLQEISEEDIKEVEELFKFEIIPVNKQLATPELTSNRPCIILINPGESQFPDRKQENQFSSRIVNLILDIRKKNPGRNNFVPCIDFEKVNMDGSQLFRFLGYWENYFPNFSTIITHLPTETFFELTRLNKNFAKLVPGLDYWNRNAVTIVYSFVPIPARDTSSINDRKFYFADCLWGATDIDYIRLNRLVHRTNFNATSLFDIDAEKLSTVENEHTPVNVSFCPAFFNHNVLLPLDLLLTDSKGATIFEHNTMVLLENEIKP